MNRMLTVIYITLSLLMANLMVSHAHAMVSTHDIGNMKMNHSCQQLCIASATTHQVDAVKPTVASLLGVMLALVSFLFVYQAVTSVRLNPVFAHDPSPPDVLSINQRFRF
jgi:hypothetical protein